MSCLQFTMRSPRSFPFFNETSQSRIGGIHQIVSRGRDNLFPRAPKNGTGARIGVENSAIRRGQKNPIHAVFKKQTIAVFDNGHPVPDSTRYSTYSSPSTRHTSRSREFTRHPFTAQLAKLPVRDGFVRRRNCSPGARR